ncbi:MAG: biotin/lipoyl-binding protein [Leptolyngbyaceae cyanobacterium SM2_3_12]|nr:biotin/lipoyl-binding protein [Leptolyngbyaceae cyanobacterium SM2_3_12]
MPKLDSSRSVEQTFDPLVSSSQAGRGRWLPGRGLLVGLGAGVLLTLVGTRLVGGPAANPEEDAPPQAAVSSQTVSVAPVVPTTVADTLAVNGTVQAIDLLSISPQVSGLQIRQMLVREGDAVSAGQVLASLDDATLQADIRQAQAQLTVAQAEVTQRQAAQAQAQANLVEAQQNLERSNSLADRGAISQQELTRQQTQALTAQEAVGVAKAEVDSAVAGCDRSRPPSTGCKPSSPKPPSGPRRWYHCRTPSHRRGCLLYRHPHRYPDSEQSAQASGRGTPGPAQPRIRGCTRSHFLQHR